FRGRVARFHLRGHLRQLADPSGGWRNNLLDLSHIHQLVVAGNVLPGPDGLLVGEHVLVGQGSMTGGENDPTEVGDSAGNRHATWPRCWARDSAPKLRNPLPSAQV